MLPFNSNPIQSTTNAYQPCTDSKSILRLSDANGVPIRGQFFIPTQLGQFANCDQSEPILAISLVIDWHGIGAGPNPCQSMPILTNPVPIPGQSVPNHVPIGGPFLTNSFVNSPIYANPCQSNANSKPFLRTIPAHNLGTSPLHGMVPSLLGG